MQVVDRVLLRPVFLGHFLVREAVPHLAVEEAMGEGVDVRVRVAVERHGDAVAARRSAALDVIACSYGLRVVGAFLGVDVAGQRDGDAVFDERGRLLALGRRDQIQRARSDRPCPSGPNSRARSSTARTAPWSPPAARFRRTAPPAAPLPDAARWPTPLPARQRAPHPTSSSYLSCTSPCAHRGPCLQTRAVHIRNRIGRRS